MILDNSKIKDKSKEFGFDLCGFSNVELDPIDIKNINEYIVKGHFGTMDWFPKHQNIRISYENLGFKPESAICLGVLYNSREYNELSFLKNFKISRYAVGEDYHKVLRKLGNNFLKFLSDTYPGFQFRQGVDTLPISEKSLAKYAGLGWIGKNTNLISKSLGSYFFLSIILTDLRLPTERRHTDHCGKCTKCLEACPTGALFEPYKIDSSRCISHATIEDRSENIEPFIENNLNNWIYGCDICQEVCPFNKKAESKNYYSNHKEFSPLGVFNNGSEFLINLDESEFQKLKDTSAISRITYKQWKRNISAVIQN